MSATFKDVAKLAGVSSQTVSRVINAAENVSQSTRVKVQAAIEQLGYIPNRAAQTLKSKRPMLGVIGLNLSYHGAAMIINGIRHRAKECDYTTAIAMIDKMHETDIESAVRELISQNIFAIILVVPVTADFAERLTKKYQQCHLLFVDAPKDAHVHRVYGANQAGARLAAEHLLALGRTRFILIAGPKASYSAQKRLNGWLEAIKQAEKTSVAVYHGDWLAASGYQQMQRAITDNRAFDAVLVGNDQMALGVLRALHDVALSVPEQVSVVGFDGTEDSEFFSPPLTTIVQDFNYQGQVAVDSILAIQQSPNEPPIRVILEVNLLQRKSSAAKTNLDNGNQQIKTLLNQALNLLSAQKQSQK